MCVKLKISLTAEPISFSFTMELLLGHGGYRYFRGSVNNTILGKSVNRRKITPHPQSKILFYFLFKILKRITERHIQSTEKNR